MNNLEDKIKSIRVIKQLNNIARETGKRYFTFQSKEFITYFIKVNDFGRTFFRSFDINNLNIYFSDAKSLINFCLIFENPVKRFLSNL